MDEEVDILLPPLFEVSGQVKLRRQAYADGDWIGTFNLWIFTNEPEPAIIYQQRSPQASWAPGMLDVTAGGHYQAGEKLTDGLREVEEELGKHYSADQVNSLGHKIYVGFNSDGSSHNNLIDIYMIEDNAPLSSYELEEKEVYALCRCPISKLLKVHHDPAYTFDVEALTAKGKAIQITVSQKSFPQNWDNYHHKIALLAQQYFKGEKDLLY